MEHKIVTRINCPKEWESTNDWDSHRPLLWLSICNTEGRVVEFGVGVGSTLLIDDFCKQLDRKFTAYETNINWLNHLNFIKNKWHGELLFHKYNYKTIKDIYFGLFFVDSAPAEERKTLINIHSNNAKVIVVHDVEPSAEYVYGMSDILSTFKYRLDYQPEGKPHTTVVSNFIDVTQWV